MTISISWSVELKLAIYGIPRILSDSWCSTFMSTAIPVLHRLHRWWFSRTNAPQRTWHAIHDSLENSESMSRVYHHVKIDRKKRSSWFFSKFFCLLKQLQPFKINGALPDFVPKRQSFRLGSEAATTLTLPLPFGRCVRGTQPGASSWGQKAWQVSTEMLKFFL